MVSSTLVTHTGMVTRTFPRTIPAAAPGLLAVVQRFMNTLDVEKETDGLASAKLADEWLVNSGLEWRAGHLGKYDHGRLIRMRTVLRDLCSGTTPSAERFAEVATATRLRPELDRDGRVYLVPAGSGVDAVIGALIAIMVKAQQDGTWDRLKICRNDRCRWVFYDLSRNRAGTWCAMGICGNRHKVARYRQRLNAK